MRKKPPCFANLGCLPILLATACAMPENRERLLAASEAGDYLQKPVYDAAELVAKVQGLLDSQ